MNRVHEVGQEQGSEAAVGGNGSAPARGADMARLGEDKRASEQLAPDRARAIGAARSGTTKASAWSEDLRDASGGTQICSEAGLGGPRGARLLHAL